ncbi:TonB-dependent receptor [Sphingomonas kyungheensis]|uniref:TonB-dependent receptor n=1 Tax=Sphingomonas kyungheensis TaxID=1069987 RepID=A0ABU8H3E5_9SPHN
MPFCIDRHAISRCTLAAAALAASQIARAEAPVPQHGQSGSVTSGKDGEIVVTTTAQKRFENIQSVPLPVQVVTPAQLELQGVHHFQELDRVMPSLVVRPAEHPVNTNVSIRGVGTFAYAVAVESSVAVTVDGAPVAFLARANTDLPDVAQIEVLRGPQSTLYGKAASAGLIKIMTVQPTDDLHIRANARLTGDHEFAETLSITGPLTDRLGYVFSGGYTHWDGNVTNLVTSKHVGGHDTLSSRAKLRWKVNPALTFTLSGNYLTGSTSVGRPFVHMAPEARLRGVDSERADVVLPGVRVGPTNRAVTYNSPAGTTYHGGGGLLRTDVALGKITLLGLTSVDRFRLDNFLDFDDTASTAPTGYVVERGTFHSQLFTQEVRLLSPDDAPFRYALGLYYADAAFERPATRGPGFALSDYHFTAGSRQIAGFGQIDWAFAPRLTATVGGRLQNERVAYTFTDRLAARRHPAATTSWAGAASDDAATYRLGLDYRATPDLMLFASYATGYKGQAYDLSTGFDQARADAGPIRPERSRDKEIGIRSLWLDRHLTANLTFFNTHYRDMQAQTIEFLPGGTYINRMTNVGRLLTRGIEIETAARPSGAVTLTANAAYLRAHYLSFPGAPCYPLQSPALGCTGNPLRQDLSGERVPQAPSWRLNASADYSPALGHDRRGVMQIAWQYQSAMQFAARDPELFQRGYHIVNVDLGVRDRQHRWQAVAFLNNVFDQQHYTALVNVANNFGRHSATEALLPRDFRRYGGIRVGVDF